MKRLILAVTFSAAALVGCRNPLADHYLNTSAANAAVDLRALRQLRKGDTNGAIYTLEVDLNLERLGVEEFLRDVPWKRNDTNIVRLLERVRAYEAEHPIQWKTNKNR